MSRRSGSLVGRKKKPPRGQLTDREKAVNRKLSRVRVRVEHAIGRMKNWKAMRHHRRQPHLLNVTGRAALVLTSLLT